MSIPPLVCSTPPPPEQCEEDKDIEDFDVQYNLSHSDDEDSNDYNYGSFSTFNQTESPSNEISSKVDISNTVKIQTIDIDSNEITNVTINDNLKVEKLSNEEDINIEDLNLRVNKVEPLDVNIKDDPGENSASGDNQDAVTDITNIPSNISTDDVNNCTLPSLEVEDNAESIGIDFTEDQEMFPAEIIEDQSNVISKKDDQINLDDEHGRDKILHPICEKEVKDLNLSSVLNEDALDDDFDDFQFMGSCKSEANSFQLEILNTCDNPWGNEEFKNSDFGNFAANFEDSDSHQNNVLNVEYTEDQLQTEASHEAANDDDDDFGDFDAFKSSASEVKELPQEISVCQQVPVLNIQSADNESQVIESINKALSSIFVEEVTESEEVFHGKLDLLLSETWGHLMETDVRQPYIVNWNNSLAQKTLLKALCIDSRNILYGPKWSYNMPKYAANLSTAPLQPQKQTKSCSNSQSETTNAEKDSSKTNTWADPFASNGQEFTYAEALLLDLEHLMATLDQMAHNHSALKISELLSHACSTENENPVIEPGPTDLDVFEATVATKSDKIYSSTLSVQPIRQINLPDTHIFTPTDSETPRSKTIHYDCVPAPTVLIPQPVDSFKSESDKPTPPSLSNVNKLDNDSDYWEFQDFKGTLNENMIPQEKKENTDTSINSVAKANVVYQTQLLQPIKLDPILPTLNWPSPGEVKETFEDFSDFVSNSSTNHKEHNVVPTSIESIKSNIDVKTEAISISNEQSTKNDVKFEDDFDTFQSALPLNKSTLFDANFVSLGSNAVSNNLQNQSISSQTRMGDFDIVFQNNNINIKADDISFTNSRNPIDVLPQGTDSNSISKDLHNVTSATSSGMIGISTNMLQPTPLNVAGQMQPTTSIGTLSHQQNTTQILQPLSLESYSQINWPNPGIDFQDLSRFNPVETLPSLKSDLSASSQSKIASPIHNQKNIVTNSQAADDDIWGEFVSSKPKQQPAQTSKKVCAFNDDDEWTDFVSSAVVKPQNGLNTISLNVHTNLTMQKSTNQSKFQTKTNSMSLDIPSLNYITPKTGNQKSYNDKHFQNL